jgi:pSer/pThr/pTyr-binding forkhead associated (FHA) protein
MSGERLRLVIRSGPNPGKAFELATDSVSIGREANNDIVIQDTEISRNHARIIRRGGGYILEDLGSTNGSFINSQQVSSPRAIVPGDEIGFGGNVVVVLEGEGTAATVAASTARGQPAARQPAPPPQPRFNTPPAAAPAPAPAPTPASRKGPSKMLLAGCGCLVVLCILAAVGAYIFDSYNGTGLYCVSPFDTVFRLVGFCAAP